MVQRVGFEPTCLSSLIYSQVVSTAHPSLEKNKAHISALYLKIYSLAGRSVGRSSSNLVLGGRKLVVIVGNELANQVLHTENLLPLVLVHGHGEATHAIHRDSALGRDLQGDSLLLGGLCLKLSILCTETLKLGLKGRGIGIVSI